MTGESVHTTSKDRLVPDILSIYKFCVWMHSLMTESEVPIFCFECSSGGGRVSNCTIRCEKLAHKVLSIASFKLVLVQTISGLCCLVCSGCTLCMCAYLKKLKLMSEKTKQKKKL